ncbi:MAG TPA: hypothetical protein VIH90_07450 [Candidatus Saccharimonadales bacterium]
MPDSPPVVEDRALQINYFPYLNMVDTPEIDFPDLHVKVWNYDLKANDYIEDPAVKSQIDLIIRANVGRWYEVKDIAIISIGNIDWRPFTAEELEICREVRLLLFIRTIARTATIERNPNLHHSLYTTENFTLMTQNFSVSNTVMGITSGFIKRATDYGFNMAEIKFQRPDHVPAPMQFIGDHRLLDDLLRLRKCQKKLYRRLLRAIEALSQAYSNDAGLSMSSRIPIIASAYESLFDLQEQSQRKILKDYFKNNIAPTYRRKYRYSSQRPINNRYPRGFDWEVEDISVMWVDKFYTLRNKIIHGTPTKSSEYSFRGKQDHFDIAVIFFIYGLKKIMPSKPQVPNTIDEVHWKIPQQRNDDWPVYEGFVYEDLDMFRGIRWS